MKKIIKMVSPVLAALALTACDSAEVTMVKTGTLKVCPDKTIEQMVNGYMGSPSWKSLKAENGKSYVNVDGQITYKGKPVKAEIQFELSEDMSSFQLHAWELDGQPTMNLVAIGLFNRMCNADLEKLVNEAVEVYLSKDEDKKEAFAKKMKALPEEKLKYVKNQMMEDPRMGELKAKSTASEMSFSMSTYIKLQDAYYMESMQIGSATQIGFVIPESSNFSYKSYNDGLIATSLVDLGDCPRGSRWILTAEPDASTGNVKWKPLITGPDGQPSAACESLTPIFKKMAEI